MPYKTYAVANAFIAESLAENGFIDPMKAQKLTYFAHGYYLAITGNALIAEYFQAWKLGPVAPTLYHDLKKYRDTEINRLIQRDLPLAGMRLRSILNSDGDFVTVKNFVWNTYKDVESIELSKLTHKKGYAWDKTLRANRGILGPPMLNEDVRADFLPLVRKDGPIRAHP